MTEKLRLPPKETNKPARKRIRTYSSMWQDLALGRRSGEAEYLNGEIVALGRKLGIHTPYNSALLESVNRMFEEGQKPGIHSPSRLHDIIRRRSAQA